MTLMSFNDNVIRKCIHIYRERSHIDNVIFVKQPVTFSLELNKLSPQQKTLKNVTDVFHSLKQ